MPYKITSFDLKLALLEYFRFTRGYVCADECLDNDIMADTGKETIEVEVKVDKWDLEKGELRTPSKIKKHEFYINPKYRQYLVPNKYYLCVPNKFKENALKVIEDLNPKYGLILFDEARFLKIHKDKRFRCVHEECLHILKPAKKLHKSYSSRLSWKIAQRASCSLITMKQKLFKENIKEQ